MKNVNVIVGAVVLMLISIESVSAFNGTGSGTEEDPNLITNVYELQKMQDRDAQAMTKVLSHGDFDAGAGSDYSDAPYPYPTAEHGILGWQWLGPKVSAESAPRKVDTYDDGIEWAPGRVERGKTFTLTFEATSTYQTEVIVMIWIDWNQDGTWADPAERVVDWEGTVYSSGSGYHRFVTETIAVPTWADLGETWLRARLNWAHSWSAPDMSPDAYQVFGECEDYALIVGGTKPVADADGPYDVNVGDTLTLDASGSTDADNDIVSYMWDLDDDGSFETDAGGEAVFDVNYSHLESIGLLIDYTYTIHLKVTDSEGQSDVNESTLRIEPKPALWVAVDIKPGSCPNPVNVKSSGVLPIAILGTADVNVLDIDPASIQLAGVGTIRSSYEDVAKPVSDGNDCNCTEDGPDGFLDLTLKFKTQEIVEAIGDVNDGDVRVLTLTGVLFDPMPFETPIEGADCILIRGRHKPINPADINKDGVVNATDFAIFAQNWLQSSIVQD